MLELTSVTWACARSPGGNNYLKNMSNYSGILQTDPFGVCKISLKVFIFYKIVCKPCGLTGTSRDGSDDAKIVNGNDLGAGDVPWQVAIDTKNLLG